MHTRVLFLGAGFSRPFGLPVMGDFFRHVRGCEHVSQADRAWLEGLQQESRRAASMLEGPPTNLEHVLSLALMNFRRSSVRVSPDGATDYDRIRRVLFAVFRSVTEKAVSRLIVRLRWLFNFGTSESDAPTDALAIVTPNYDLVTEYTLFLLGTPPKLPVSWTRLPRDKAQGSYESLYADAGGPLLCKLHGSVNWFPGPAGVTEIHVEDRVGPYQRLGDRIEPFRYPLCADHDQAYGEAPLIVPPMYFKHQVDGRLDASWAAAAKVIAGAERLAFVGYSFPRSDTHMAYFLASALNENVRLEHVSIVAPDAKQICDRLRSESYGPHFKGLLQETAIEWQDGQYGLA